jgi:TonB family protein
MLTPMTCFARQRFKGIKAALAFLLVAPMSALAQKATTGDHLYLLAEIAVDYRGHRGGGGSGLYLYALEASHKLKLIREVVPVPDVPHADDYGQSFYAVRDDMGDKIYVAYPSIDPSMVSVIHKETPTLKDEVEFNPQHSVVFNSEFGIAAGEGRQSYLLCTLIRDTPRYVSVAGDAPAHGPRVQQSDGSMFKAFRYRGEPGGTGSDLLGYIVDNYVRTQRKGLATTLDFDVTPPFPLDTAPQNTCVIVAANARYFAFVPLIGSGMANLGPDNVAPYVCVHDRQRNTWKKLMSASNFASTRRIFGAWLATIVEVWHPGEMAMNPGAEDGPSQIIIPGASVPGILVLDNLEDGRRIILKTGQADSEILNVGEDGRVLYRVNDSIFSAEIEGDKLTNPTLAVQDGDVTGVHWVFWSPAASVAAPSIVRRIREGQGGESARLIFHPAPEYPPDAKRAGVQGIVFLAAVISQDGTIQDLRVAGGNPLLVQAALDAVKHWRYQPMVVHGEPVEVETLIRVRFTLPQ